MTPFMTRWRRRLLIPIIHLITRIYHAYRLCTDQVRPPFAFRIIQGRLVPVSSSLVRDLLSFATRSTNQKFYIIQLLSSHRWVLFACTLYIMYHQGCRLSHLYEYLLRYPWIFFILFFRRVDLFSFLIVREVTSVAFSGNNASLHFGDGVCFTLILNCVIN